MLTMGRKQEPLCKKCRGLQIRSLILPSIDRVEQPEKKSEVRKPYDRR